VTIELATVAADRAARDRVVTVDVAVVTAAGAALLDVETL
jgi:hypothetical protein